MEENKREIEQEEQKSGDQPVTDKVVQEKQLNDNQNSYESFDFFLQKLDFTARKIKQIGMLLFLIFLTGVITIVVMFLANTEDVLHIVFYFSLCIPVLGIVILFYYQVSVSHGNTLYEEIVDEIEWNYKKNSSKDGFEKMPLNTRVMIKNYVKSRDLPFAEGKLGPSVYLAAFILLLVGSLFFYILIKNNSHFYGFS